MTKRAQWAGVGISMIVLAGAGYGLLGSALAQDAKPGKDAPPPPPPQREDGRPRGDGPPGRRQDGPPNLERSMKGMNRALKTLHDQVKDTAKLADNLQLVSDAQRSCVAAKSAPIPEELLESAKDYAAKKQLTAKFRKDLIAVLKKLIEMEENLLDGKADAAAAALDAVLKLRDESHKALGVKDEE